LFEIFIFMYMIEVIFFNVFLLITSFKEMKYDQ
jgi:hypothetical protein